MRRLVIAIDCDDVLVPTTPFFVDAYNDKFGTSVQLGQAHVESYDVWQADRPEVEQRLADLMDTDGYRLLGPTDEAVRVLKDLAQDHELHVVTARREHEREFTLQMLDTKLGGIFTSMEFVGFVGSKGEVCERIRASVLIDDNLRHLENAIEHGLPSKGAILFGDYAWNSSVNTDDMQRCLNWDEVKAIIDKLANEKEDNNGR